MAQNVTIAGRQYSAVPAIDVPKTGGGTATFTDVTDTTRIAGDVRQGKYFFTASGVLTLGTATGGGTGGVTQDQDGYLVLDDQGGTSVTVEPITITQNGTTTAPAGTAYSPVTVNVSGGGGLVYEEGIYEPTQDTARANISFTDTHTERPYSIIMSDIGDTIASDGSNVMWALVDWGDLNNVIPGATNYASMLYAYMASGSVSLVNVALSSSGISNWATESGFLGYAQSSSRIWRAGRKYRWVAAWKPTT